MAEKQPPQHVEETAPDPEEDDLDDLDDVLDEFQAPSVPPPKPNAPTPPTTASGPERPPSSDDKDVALPSDEEMASQLQAGMSSLISELDSNPDMQKEFEKMMQELIAAGAASSDDKAAEHIGKAAEGVATLPGASSSDKGGSSEKGGSSSKKPEDFQSTIRKTMERMQASGDAATAASSTKAAAGGLDEDMLSQMMRELGGGEGEEGDFNSLLMNMMAQLTHKEILYEPMKELSDNFPDWVETNKAKCTTEDMGRYLEQQKLVGEIVGRFERKGYSDDNADDREYIVDRMQKMQAAGSPPPDLVGDMSAAQEALGDLEGGCPTQ